MIQSAYSIDVNEDESHEKKSGGSKENEKGKVDHKKTTTKKNQGSGKHAGLPWAHKKINH
ncbi:hypothetical protein GCK32_020930 [Trichostrongylus colubriformis]|uniref:Uncharacterized protein n=1 Tax=Trichostrongylus colubriformis TaxID=6319 RepID=A0AAN8FE04_TRICO